VTRAWMFFLIVDALAIAVGVYMVYGVLRGHKELVEPPDKRGQFRLSPYRLFGKEFTGPYHLFVGILFIFMALFGLAFFFFQQ
jgi:hypothetical protein